MQFTDILKLNETLSLLDANAINCKYNHKIDTFHLPYLDFLQSFELPGLALDGIKYNEANMILNQLIQFIPQYLIGTQVLPEPRPTRDLRQLHFVRHLRCDHQDYIYIFRIHLAYMGGAFPGEIIRPATQGITPAFLSNRLYYQARIVPVNNIVKQEGQIVDFESAQMKDMLFEVSSSDTKRNLWSSVLFDEVDFGELNQTFIQYFGFDSEWQLGKLFAPFEVDYLTLCLNLINPEPVVLDQVLPFFHEGYCSFLKNQQDYQASESTEYFWSTWFAAYRKKLAPARSGNPHWLITAVPEGSP